MSTEKGIQANQSYKHQSLTEIQNATESSHFLSFVILKNLSGGVI